MHCKVFRQKCIREYIACAERIFERRGPSGCPENVEILHVSLIGIESLPDQMSETKGAMITGTTLKSYNIGVNAFLHGTTSKYIDDLLKYGDTSHSYAPEGSETSNHWVPVEGHTYYWPKANNLDFWAWAPNSEIQKAISATATNAAKITFAEGATSFVTTGAGPISFNYNLGEGTDADNLPDLMFSAITNLNQENVTTANPTGCVPLEFKHALASVQFKVVAAKGGKVTDIKLIGVTKSGDCTFSVAESGATSCAWSTPQGTSTYGHNFNTTLEKNVASDFYSAEGNQAATFMMIPQTLGTQQISISIARDAASGPAVYTGTIPTSTSISAWEAGKTYVYTINIDEYVNVTISDEVSTSNEKSDLTVTNTGSTKAYLRAVIVGNWKDGNGKVMNTPWTPAQGTWTVNGAAATAPGGADTGWILGTDGYYYYKYQVPAGATTIGTLFDSFAPIQEKTPKNAHLEMSIAVQAIQANLLIGTDGNFKTDPYGWKTTGLSKDIDAESNFTSGN